jgi:two-component system sensor histidine kinase YesM
MTLPLVGMLLYNNFYAIKVVREQVADSYSNTLSQNMSQIDADLNDVDSYMNTISGMSSDLMSLSLAENDDDYYMAKVYLHNKLVNDFALYRSMSAFFVFVEHREDYMEVPNNNISFNEKERVKQYVYDLILREKIPKGLSEKRWQYARIGQNHYLIDIVQAGDAYLGACVNTDQLLMSLGSLKLGEGGITLLANDQGEPITNATLVFEQGIELRENLNDYYLSGDEKKYLVIGTPSKKGNFQMFALIPDSTILDKLPYMQRIIWFISTAVLIFVPIGFYFMRLAFLVPLGKVLFAMKKVRSGDWNIRVDLNKDTDEFKLLGNSFNSMMDEIQRLRTNVYEEQLNKQREELQRLQLQINPHFFLNALNIVYNLAKVKNFNLIMEMTMALIHYFRYLFRSNTSFVKLKDELEHTRNYLNIQAMRFPGKLTWSVDSPEYLTDVPVPPLIIQSFAENSIKHAVTMEEPVHISVQIGFADEESGSMIKIRIEDTGQGFRNEVLQVLQEGKSVENDRGEHTGIWNVQRRLRLLYQETSFIRFFNNMETGGAVVEIILPAEPAKGEQR